MVATDVRQTGEHAGRHVPVYPVSHVTGTASPVTPVIEAVVDLSEFATSVSAQLSAAHVTVVNTLSVPHVATVGDGFK